ncbi:exported hypothetical protein [Streptomyces misionensis JCM 4497]
MPSTGRSSSNHSKPSEFSTAWAREANRFSRTSRCSAGTVSTLIFTTLMTPSCACPPGSAAGGPGNSPRTSHTYRLFTEPTRNPRHHGGSPDRRPPTRTPEQGSANGWNPGGADGPHPSTADAHGASPACQENACTRTADSPSRRPPRPR